MHRVSSFRCCTTAAKFPSRFENETLKVHGQAGHMIGIYSVRLRTIKTEFTTGRNSEIDSRAVGFIYLKCLGALIRKKKIPSFIETTSKTKKSNSFLSI